VRRKRAIGLWLLFVMIQALGVVIPRLTNIHSNIWPAFGLLLLVPGIVVVLLLGLTFWSIALAILVNAATLYYAVKSFNDGPERP
jgi:hypothetical protein